MTLLFYGNLMIDNQVDASFKSCEVAIDKSNALNKFNAVVKTFGLSI